MQQAITALRLEPLRSLTPADKVVWLYLAASGPGEHGVRDVAEGTGLAKGTVQSALGALQAAGLVAQLEPGGARRPARLEARAPTA